MDGPFVGIWVLSSKVEFSMGRFEEGRLFRHTYIGTEYAGKEEVK